jgi:hypothetical protein
MVEIGREHPMHTTFQMLAIPRAKGFSSTPDEKGAPIQVNLIPTGNTIHTSFWVILRFLDQY